MRLFGSACLIALSSGAVLGQQPEAAPRFEIADVHVTPKSLGRVQRTGAVASGGRFEMKGATMLDLIQTAYGYSDEAILEGPNWLEMDHFDITAKLPAGTDRETRNLMLRTLLADRFQLVVRKEERPLPAYALVSGKKPLLKPADGSGETGCKPKAASGPPDTGGMMIGLNGVQIALGPGSTIEFDCRNISMEDFAARLRGMFGVDLPGSSPVKDETGLKGNWNFDVRWSIGFIGLRTDSGDHVSIAEAVEKQLGLKLEQRQVPTPVLVVESVNRKPSDNPPGTAEALPPLKSSTEFEVADVKPSAPGGRGGMRIQPGGRLSGSVPLAMLVRRAFISLNLDELAGIPDWALGTRFDIVAKAPADAAQGGPLTMQTLAPMIRSLLADRFKMTWHTEERPVTTYTLVAIKPKMKRADPKVRASCRDMDAPPGSPPGSESLVCKDVTMEQFADSIQGMAQGLNWPITDATELEGGWDFTLTYSRFPDMGPMGPGRGGDAGTAGGALPVASEPSSAVTIFEAVEKQLGLKLAPRKRNMPIIVIDHLEQKPTEN
jgi:uncharacterized protein (TIGR03435 family)